MQKLLIKGKRELSGKISISGSKNATLPILAACILSNHALLKNIPLVKDIFTMVELLKFIGLKTKIHQKKNTIEVINDEKNINTLAPYKLVKTMRAGVLVLGSLLAKYGKAKVSLPGGCAIGSRPVDLHLFALKKLGAKIKIKDGYIFAEAKKGLKGSVINFPTISVGATENALLAASKAEGKTVLKNCAIEPEIKDLILFLKKLGSIIYLKKNKKLKKINISTKPYPGFPTDLQAQLMVLLTQVNGISKIKEDIFENRFMHVPELRRMGAKIAIKDKTAIITGPTKLTGAEVMATDLRASVSLVLAGLVAENRTIVNRIYHLDRGYEFLERKLKNCKAEIKRL